jgi:ATP synthase protein I
MSDRTIRSDRWPDDGGDRSDEQVRVLTRQEAQALRNRWPSVSPWRVLTWQMAVGFAVAAMGWFASGERAVGMSALYGAACVVMPGVLLARGMSSRSFGSSARALAVSFMSWHALKIAVSVCMLAVAPLLIRPLEWWALLAALVLCLKVYWLALLWRGNR